MASKDELRKEADAIYDAARRDVDRLYQQKKTAKTDVAQNTFDDLPQGGAKSDPMSPTPFPYDPNVLGELRPDQVPRFLGAITHPPSETKVLPLRSLTAIQNRIDLKKVRAMRAGNVKELPTVVRFNGKNYIVDGHHRLTAAHLDGDKVAEVRFKDITAHSQAVKGGDQRPFDEDNEFQGIPTTDQVQKTVLKLKADGMFGTAVTWRSDLSAALTALAAEVSKAGGHKSPPKGYPTDRAQYAIPHKFMFPIDRKHIHAAIAYFSHHRWQADDNKRQAAQRIMHAARRFGIQIDADDTVAQAAR